jgi:hypothetical protein
MMWGRCEKSPSSLIVDPHGVFRESIMRLSFRSAAVCFLVILAHGRSLFPAKDFLSR